MRCIKLLKGDETAATAVEYALILAGVATLIIVVVFLLGGRVNNALNKVAGGFP